VKTVALLLVGRPGQFPRRRVRRRLPRRRGVLGVSHSRLQPTVERLSRSRLDRHLIRVPSAGRSASVRPTGRRNASPLQSSIVTHCTSFFRSSLTLNIDEKVPILFSFEGGRAVELMRPIWSEIGRRVRLSRASSQVASSHLAISSFRVNGLIRMDLVIFKVRGFDPNSHAQQNASNRVSIG
jgi:hypothetical protein